MSVAAPVHRRWEAVALRLRAGRTGGSGIASVCSRPPSESAADGNTAMAMTFDATLKDMARHSPHGFLAAFDRPPTSPVRLLNVDLSTATSPADLVLGPR